jgi:drug/metabolite transporter, DME family
MIGLFTPALLEVGLRPTDIGFGRALLGGLCFLVHGAARRQLRLERGRDVAGLLVFGSFAVGLFYVALAAVIDLGGVSLAWILLYTAPAWVALGAVVVLRERVDRVRAALIGVTVLGVALVALGGGAGVRISVGSVLWGLVAGWTYALWYVAGKRYLDRYTPVTISAWTLLAGAVALLPFARWHALPAHGWLLLIGLAVVSTYLPALAYYSGLRHAEATRASIVATVEPVVALGIAIVFAGERLEAVAVVGASLVLVAATIASSRGKRDPLAHGPPQRQRHRLRKG